MISKGKRKYLVELYPKRIRLSDYVKISSAMSSARELHSYQHEAFEAMRHNRFRP